MNAKELSAEFNTKMTGPVLIHERQAEEREKRVDDCSSLCTRIDDALSADLPLGTLDWVYDLLEQALDELE